MRFPGQCPEKGNHDSNTAWARRGSRTWHGPEGHVLFPTQRRWRAEPASGKRGGRNERCEKQWSEGEEPIPLKRRLCAHVATDTWHKRERQGGPPPPACAQLCRGLWEKTSGGCLHTDFSLPRVFWKLRMHCDNSHANGKPFDYPFPGTS